MGGGGGQEPRQLEGEQFPGGRGFRPARPVLLTPGKKPGPADVQSVVGSLGTAWDPFLYSLGSVFGEVLASLGAGSAANPGRLNLQSGSETQHLLEAGSVQRDDFCSLKSQWRDWQRKESVRGAVTHLAYSSGQGICE